MVYLSVVELVQMEIIKFVRLVENIAKIDLIFMKEEFIQLWKDYKKSFGEWEDELYGMGGETNKKPDMDGFVRWLEYGYIS